MAFYSFLFSFGLWNCICLWFFHSVYPLLFLLVFDWLHSVDKITIMQCCCFHRDAVYFRVFRYSEFISLIWKEPYYDKLQCYKLQEDYFRNFRKILCRFQIKKVGSFISVQMAQSSFWTLIGQQHLSGRRGNTFRMAISVYYTSLYLSGLLSNMSGHSSEFQRNLAFLVHQSGRRGNTNRTPVNVRQVKGFPSQTQIWEDSCNRPDDKSTPSGRYP